MANIGPWGITETTDGRVFAYGMAKGDTTPIFEITKGKSKLVQTPKGVEGIIGFGKRLMCVGSSFADGPQMHILDGKKWSTYQTGDASIFTMRIVDGALVGSGRDGAVGSWDDKKKRWMLLTPVSESLHLVGLAAYKGSLVVAGQTRKRTGIVGVVTGKKITPSKLPTKEELNAIGALADGRLVVTGRSATVLIGTPDAMTLIPPGKFKASFGTPLEWEGRILIAGREDGIVELADGQLRSFSKAPGSRLSTVAKHLWRLDGKAGLSTWTKGDWSTIPLSA